MADQTWNDTPGIFQSLAGALNTYDWKQARSICGQLVARLNRASVPFPERPAKEILNLLRRKRQFECMEVVGDAFIRSGQGAHQILRQYAQAMIDQGNFTASRLVLETIADDSSAPASERAEANGLLGHIYKQIYVNANDPSNPRQRQNLIQAIQYYYGVYRTDPRNCLWHGMNTVALLARAERDKVPAEGLPSALEIAHQIDSFLSELSALQYWDRATAVENAVAMSEHPAAREHLIYYVADPQVDAFECASLLRQLSEVWQLDASKEPGTTLLPTLKACLLSKEGGKIELARESIVPDGKSLEKIFGNDRYQPLPWLRTALTRCEAVARIESVMGQRVGTGFLVKASDFFPGRDSKELLMLTNAHVISSAESGGALKPEAAQAVFEARGQTYRVGKLIWSSPLGELDATFVTLPSLAEDSQLCPLTPQPEPFDNSKQQRLYVIGYPLGGGLSFSLQDSVWLDTNGKYLHYRTPTEPGSSGSPVFDQQYWTVVGLHHAGEKNMPRLNGEPGTYDANEGISIAAIQNATR